MLFNGAPNEAILKYENENNVLLERCEWSEDQAPGDKDIKLLGMAVTQQRANATLDSSEPVIVTIDVLCTSVDDGLTIGFELFWRDGTTLWYSHCTDGAPRDWPTLTTGFNRLVCALPANWLNTGRYAIAPRISIHNRRWIVNVPPCLEFDVSLNHGESPYWTNLSSGGRPGPLAPILHWRKDTSAHQHPSKPGAQSDGATTAPLLPAST
jgi:hypothetical protein